MKIGTTFIKIIDVDFVSFGENVIIEEYYIKLKGGDKYVKTLKSALLHDGEIVTEEFFDQQRSVV